MTITTIGAGIGGSWGMVEESTGFGLVQASPTWTFLEPNSVVPKKVKNVKQSSGLAAGRYVDLASRRVVVSQAATVQATFDLCTAGGFAKLINQISSSYAKGTAGSQAANGGIYSAGARLTPAAPVFGYTHTFRNSIASRSVAQQIGVPTTDGILRQYDVLGAKPTKYTFTQDKEGFLVLATEWDGRVLEDPLITTAYQGYPNGATQTPYSQATPSYVMQTPFHFAEAQIQIGTSIVNASNAALVDGVTKFELAVERKMNTGRQYLGNAGLKDEQITNAPLALTGTITSDYVNKTYWADAFYSDTPLFVILTLSTAAPAATVPAIQFVLGNAFLNADSPGLANMDISNTAFPFELKYDLANEPLTVIQQTTDATI